MPRNTSGEFYYAPGTEAQPDEVARSAHYNERFAEVGLDLNIPRPITAGGTGASTAAGARAQLGVAGIGVVNVFTQRQTISAAAEEKLRLLGSDTHIVQAYNADGALFGQMVFHDVNNIVRLSILPRGNNPGGALEIHRDGNARINGAAILTESNVTATVGNSSVVGSVMFLYTPNSAAGAQVVSGAGLRPAGLTATGTLFYGSSPMAGTWRVLGACPAGGATLFIRIT